MKFRVKQIALDFCPDLYRNLLQNASALLLDHKNLSKTIDLILFRGCLALCSLRSARNDTNSQSSGCKLRLRQETRLKTQILGCFFSKYSLFRWVLAKATVSNANYGLYDDDHRKHLHINNYAWKYHAQAI